MANYLKNVFAILLIFSLSILLITGCKKNNSGNSLVVLNLFPKVSADSLVLGTKIYANPSGRNITFTKAQYYVSDINLVGTNGSLQPIAGVLLITPQTTQYILGSVPVGSYKSIQFSVGVDTSLNHVDPSAQTAGSPLELTTMHFATDSLGYIFLALQGMVDTSASGTSTPNVNYGYYIGTDSLFETVLLPDHSASPYNAVFNANGGKLLTINLNVDFNSLLRNLNMKVSTGTMTTDFPVVADTIAAHIPAMFSYEQ